MSFFCRLTSKPVKLKSSSKWSKIVGVKESPLVSFEGVSVNMPCFGLPAALPLKLLKNWLGKLLGYKRETRFHLAI